tara:strand:- start:416 stop:634 length:219 start_codon:yes stop_codon:yes gene_type:complete
MDIVINGLLIEIKNVRDIKYPNGHWKRKKIFIHDVVESGLEEAEMSAIVQYLYDEGFIEDRRTPCEIIKPEV